MAGNHGRVASRSFGHMEVGSSALFWLVGARGCAPSQLRWCQSTGLDGAGWTSHQMRMRGTVWLWVALAALEGPGNVPQWVGMLSCWRPTSGDMGRALGV